MKLKRIINVAFCFDKKFIMQTCVSITSLLVSAQNRCNYHIYCIVSKDLTSDDLECLKEVVRKFSEKSKITFLYENGQYDKAYIPSHMNYLSKATYYKIMLPDLLNGIDKIIYIDSDTVILKDLIEMDNINLRGNLLIGRLDFMNKDIIWEQKLGKYRLALEKNKYVNAGILIMDLKKMKQKKLSQQWIKLSRKKLRYQEQDILNSTCLGSIGFLDSKYNVIIIDRTKITTDTSIKAATNAVILHFVYPKPWIEKAGLSNIWWKYAKMTKFYDQLRLNYYVKIKERQNNNSAARSN